MDLKKIDIQSKLSAKEHLILHAYYAFIFPQNLGNWRLNVFKEEETEKIIFYQKFIEDYNNMLDTDKLPRFQQHLSILSTNDIKTYIEEFEAEVWKYEKPVIWSDRSKSAYYLQNLIESHRFELYIEEQFKKLNFDIGLFYRMEEQYSGESARGVEIKLDKLSSETGNLFIETEESLTKEQAFVNSGILKNDNSKIIAIGNYEEIYYFRKNDLQCLYANIDKYPRLRKTGAIKGTSKGFLMPKTFARKMSLSMNEVIEYLGK